MREPIGGVWLLQLVILFTLIYVGYVILTLNYSQTIKQKNDVVNMVEKYEGINEKSISLINDFLKANNYDRTGLCTSDSDTRGVYGAYDLNSNQLVQVEPGEKYYYCIKKFHGANVSYYYQVTLFYRFYLPVIGDFARYSVRGTTGNFKPMDESIYSEYIGG